MSNNSFLDEPLLKVSRPVAACSRCRTAKIKCDGKLPACSACEKVGRASTCSGASDEFARGKERSYVASLESYCEKLEKRIAEIRRHKQAVSPGETGVVRESSITSDSSNGALAHAHRKEASDIDDLVGDFGFLSVNATSRDFNGITSNTSFANLLLSLSFAGYVPQSVSEPLPPRTETAPLLQHYIDIFFVQMPFFVETNFWTSVDNVYEKGGRFAKSSDQWFVRVALAIAFASLSNQAQDGYRQRAKSMLLSALRYSEEVLRPGSIPGIQAILLLAQYSLLDPKNFRSWYLVGMAARAMVDLGLHQEPPAEILPAKEQLDIRRNVFHCIYCLDRGVSSALERTFSFSDDSVNVALPSTAASTPNHIFSRNTDYALHLVKIRQILSIAYQKKYFERQESALQSSVSTWTLCADAREWFDNLPKDPPSHFAVIFKLELLYTTVMIFTPFSPNPSLCDYSKALLLDYCIKYIAQLHSVLENPKLQAFMTYLDMERVYQVGTRLLETISQNYDLLLDPSPPTIPSVPQNTSPPPVLEANDWINLQTRAIDGIKQVKGVLHYGKSKWGMATLLEEFRPIAAPFEEQLVQPALYYHPDPVIYVDGATAVPPPVGAGFPNFNLGPYE